MPLRDICSMLRTVCAGCLEHVVNDKQFHVLFGSISVISGQWEGVNERLCAMVPCILQRESNPGPLDQQACC